MFRLGAVFLDSAIVSAQVPSVKFNPFGLHLIVGPPTRALLDPLLFSAHYTVLGSIGWPNAIGLR